MFVIAVIRYYREDLSDTVIIWNKEKTLFIRHNS